MNRVLRWVVVASLGIAWGVCAADGVKKGGGEGGRAAYPERPNPTASAEAQRKVSEAQSEVSKAQGAVSSAASTLRKEFEGSQPFKDAQDALKAAQDKLAAARKPVIDGLKSNAAYQKALANKQALVKQREGMSADDPQIPSMAAKILEAGRPVAAIESAAVDKDPGVKAAKAEVDQAVAKLNELKKEFEGGLKDNNSYLLAKQNVDAANEKLTAAKSELSSAQQSDAQALKTWREQTAAMEQANKNKYSGEGGKVMKKGDGTTAK